MSDKLSVREALADLLAWLDEKPKPLSESIKDDEPLRKIERARAALSSPDDTAEKLAALDGIAAFFRGEDDSCGLPEHFDRLAGYEAVDVTLNARTIRAVLAATAKAVPPKEGT